jgi:DNA-binding transcriptional LysR family regulator
MDSLSAMELFVQVVQSGSFSAAARSLDLTPSAVSKQISRLEDRLAARLITRTTRQFNLTEEGRAYYERSTRILADVAEAEQAVSQIQGVARGLLRLNLPVAFGRRHVAPLLPAFLAGHPELTIDLTLNDRYVDLVEEGVDLAVRIGELEDSSLIARRLAPNRRVVCGAPAYFENRPRPERPAELEAHNCLVYTYRASRNDWRFHGPGGSDEVVQVAGNLEANNAEALSAALLGGLGLGLLPLWLVGDDLNSGRLVEVLKRYHAPDSAIYAVYPPGRHLSPKVRSFVDFLAARFARREAWCAGT